MKVRNGRERKLYRSRILKTASFKLAAAYVILFGASVAVLAAIVYLTATAALDHQERTRLTVEARVLQTEFRRGGLEKMMDDIRARARAHLIGGLDYTVVTSAGKKLFGNIPSVKLESGWTRLKGPPDGDEPPRTRERLLVYSVRLSPTLWLEVGDDIGRELFVGKAIMATSGWVLLVVATLAIAGGVLLSLSVLSRIDSITRTAEAIIDGDLERRIPLRGVGDDIDRLASTLNSMLDRISSLLSALRQVSRHVAHDLRTPLGRLRQRLEEARRQAASLDDYENAVSGAIGETDRILDTFAALLRIAEIDSGTRRAGFQIVDLSSLVNHIGQSYVPVAEDAGRQLNISASPDVSVEGDRELISQLIVNLLENALRHTQDGATVWLGLSQGTDGPLLAVRDNGPGMPDDERQRVLGRFHRLGRTRSSDGHGVGLSLIAAIADLHRAVLNFENRTPGLAVSVRFERSGRLRSPDQQADRRVPDVVMKGSRKTPVRRFAAYLLGHGASAADWPMD